MGHVLEKHSELGFLFRLHDIIYRVFVSLMNVCIATIQFMPSFEYAILEMREMYVAFSPHSMTLSKAIHYKVIPFVFKCLIMCVHTFVSEHFSCNPIHGPLALSV